VIVARLLYLRPTTMSNVGVNEVCSLCGRASDADIDGDPPVTWCADIVETRDGPATRWLCAACTRKYVRSIESKLDQTWW
jgi:hypothetical protein